MGQISQALGLGSQFEFKGKTYNLAPWTFKIQGLFERYLEDRAIQVVRRMVKVLPRSEYDDLMARTVRDIAAGIYTFGNEVVQQAMASVENLQYLVWLMLKENHPDATQDLVKDMFQEQLDIVVQKMNEANADPTKPQEGATP